MKLITLKDYKDGKVTIKEVFSRISEELDPNDYFLSTKVEIAFKALKLFNFRKLENTPESIKLHCRKVLECEPWLRSQKDSVRVFLLTYLDIKLLPAQIKHTLEAEAKRHLKILDVLLEHYSSLGFIARYQIKPETPRNQFERTILEFTNEP